MLFNEKNSKLVHDASVQIRMPRQWWREIKIRSFQESLRQGEEVRWTDLVRGAIQSHFGLVEPGEEGGQEDGDHR